LHDFAFTETILRLFGEVRLELVNQDRYCFNQTPVEQLGEPKPMMSVAKIIFLMSLQLCPVTVTNGNITPAAKVPYHRN
jgi:hypothetical protein